jgi:hypothetical protein
MNLVSRQASTRLPLRGEESVARAMSPLSARRHSRHIARQWARRGTRKALTPRFHAAAARPLEPQASADPRKKGNPQMNRMLAPLAACLVLAASFGPVSVAASGPRQAIESPGSSVAPEPTPAPTPFSSATPVATPAPSIPLEPTPISSAPPDPTATPENDLPSGAIALASSLPQFIAQDTTGATVTTDDIGCGFGGFNQASVWYTFSPASDLNLAVDAVGSSYDVGINVFAGVADPDALVTCFAWAGTVELQGGVTYYLMFGDINPEDAINGGRLFATLDVAAPPIEMALSVDPRGVVTKSGEATITGTLTCTTVASFAEVSITVRQSIGRFIIHGSTFGPAECGPAPTAWKLTVVGDNGRFAGGNATVDAQAFACDNKESCDDQFVTASVRLGR